MGLSDERKFEISRATKLHSFKGEELARDMFKRLGNRIVVYFDPDFDGMISGYFACKMLSLMGKDFSWYVNSNRRHDWTIPYKKLKDIDVVAVDFLITPEEVKEIVDSGCNLLSIDHHVNSEKFIEYESKNGKKGVVINNQYPFEEPDGEYLSGAGVVFELFCAIDERFNTVENRALVGITLLSDVRDLENNYARGYLYDLYNHKYKGYIKYLIDATIGKVDYGFGVPRMDRNYVDFKASPAVNASLRFNQQDDVVRFFLGVGELDLEYHKMQKELVEEILKVTKMLELVNLRVCYFLESSIEKNQEVLSSFVGLAASRYLDGVHSVILYMTALNDEGKPYVKRASFRGNINGNDYRKALEGIIEGVGHPSAFGIKNLIPSNPLFERINNICQDLDNGKSARGAVIDVSNLSFFSSRDAKRVGTENAYCLAQNRTYVRYTGNGIQKKRSGANYQEYSIDGIAVMCFDKTVDFNNGLILPILERKLVAFYLEKMD